MGVVGKPGGKWTKLATTGETHMSEQQKFEITVGMRVMVKVAAREIPATVIEVRDDCFIVRSNGTGREFKTTRVVDILDVPETESAEIANAAEEIADEEAATAELRRQENEAQAADDAGGDAAAEEEVAETEEAVEAAGNEDAADAPDAGEADTDPQKDVGPLVDASVDEEAKAEPPKEETAKTGEPPKADDAKDGADAAPAEAEGEARPRKNLSLVEAAVEVLKAEKRPMGVKELVKLATERGLWIPTKAKTPEQSLYGGLYLEMKNSAHPRIKKSATKGCFELLG